MTRRLHWSVVATLLLACATTPLHSQGVTSGAQPIRLVVGVPAGGTVDTMARAVAEALAERMSTTVIVDNRAGASGLIAAEAVLAAEPDGRTLLVAFPTYTSLPLTMKAPRVDFNRDFQPVGIFARTPFVLFTGPSLAGTSVKGLIDKGRAEPGRLSFGSADVTTRLAAELFTTLAGFNALHVPYKGGSPMATDIAGGQVDFGFLGVASTQALRKAGRIEVLAVANDQRMALLPDVPTLEEAGVSGYRLQPWVGLAAPAKVPPQNLKAVREAMAAVASSAGLQRRLRELGAEPVNVAPAEAAREWRAEAATFAELGKRAGIVAE